MKYSQTAFSLLHSSNMDTQLSNMNILIKICIIHLFVDCARVVALEGDNVRDVTKREFPFIVSISDRSNEIVPVESTITQFCTGSLITNKHVLTAQHCLINKEVELVKILVGSDNLDSSKTYDPESWINYQEWKYFDPSKFPPYYHDIAVITLKDCVTEANTRPAVISKFDPFKLIGPNVKMAGWGKTNDENKPKVLKTVDLKILSQEECMFRVISHHQRIKNQLHSWHLCSESDPWALNECGDSGGPLLNEKNEIVAVTAGTCPNEVTTSKKHAHQVEFINLMSKSKLNLHTSLRNYKDFLESFTKSAEARQCNMLYHFAS